MGIFGIKIFQAVAQGTAEALAQRAAEQRAKKGRRGKGGSKSGGGGCTPCAGAARVMAARDYASRFKR